MTDVIVPVGQRYHALIDTKTFERVSKRIMKDHGFAAEVADQILDSTLGFLAMCGNADKPLAPSELVDIGWHTFLMYTPEYMRFCHEHTGHFIHHVPNDDPESPSSGGGSANTVRYMRAHAIAFDPLMWGMNEDGSPCLQQGADEVSMQLCGIENGRGPGCRNATMSDCDQGRGGGGSGWDGCKGIPK